MTVEQVGQELGVEYVLEGSVQKAGERVRINVQLVNTHTGHHLWAERYDRELTDVFALQDEVVRQVVAALEVSLAVGEQERLGRKYTTNLEAYDTYLRGKAYQLRATKDGYVQAKRLYERAIALDPDFALAYVQLGWVCSDEWSMQYSQDDRLMERAGELAQQAIRLDHTLPDAYMFLGYLYSWKDHQHERGIAEIERALALAPNSAFGYGTLAAVLNLASRPAEALPMAQKAMRLNPHYEAWVAFELGHAYAGLGRYEEAVRAQKDALSRRPDLLCSHIGLVHAYSELGQEEEARKAAAEVRRISPQFSLDVVLQTWPYSDRPGLARFVANLRQAGLE